MDYYVSSSIGTCCVVVKNGIIIDTARLWKKFIGQRFDNLRNWLKKFGNLHVEEI